MNIVRKIKRTTLPSKYKTTYELDGSITVHNNGFMKESDFMQAEKAGAETGSWANIQWRVRTNLWAANHCKNIEGDFVECGTNKRQGAKAIRKYIGFKNISKTFYLIDTFEGLDETLLTESEKAAGKKELFQDVYTDCYEQVKNTFANVPNVKLIKGSVPGTLAQVPGKKIAYLSIDMNNVVAEIAAMDYFWIS